MASTTHGLFPFGESVQEVKQVDNGRPRRIFVLGVYASAVHACWKMDNKVIVRAMAVASEPCIFWNGEGADAIIARVNKRVPETLGELVSAGKQFNGPSGQALDEHILSPLGVARDKAWLCDLRPWSCSNEGQVNAIARYEKRRAGTSARAATVETAAAAKAHWADEGRQTEIMAELRRSQAPVLVTLGDQPLQHFVHPRCGKGSRLRGFKYGQLVPITLAGLSLQLLPLAHPRQIAGLGAHSADWRNQHKRWEQDTAAEVSTRVGAMQ